MPWAKVAAAVMILLLRVNGHLVSHLEAEASRTREQHRFT